MKKIAIYDVDYTIISINSLLAFIILFMKRKPLKMIFIPFLFFVTVLWFLKIISTEKVKSFWLIMFNKISEKKMNDFSNEFINKIIVPKIKPQAIESINNYKQKGYLIIFASASFEIYIKYLAEYLKADYSFGTKIVINDEKLTIKIDGKNCRGKEKINRILESIPIKKIQKKGSVGYSDSMSDLPFLELAEKFYKIKRKKWTISKIIKK